MKKTLHIDISIILTLIKRFFPYISKIIFWEKFNNFEINKICWTGKKDFDSNLNNMKARALKFMHFYVNLINNHKLKIEEEEKNELLNLINFGMDLMENVISNKFEYLNSMENHSKEFPNYFYEEYLTNYLLFFEKILVIEPFLSIYLSIVFK